MPTVVFASVLFLGQLSFSDWAVDVLGKTGCIFRDKEVRHLPFCLLPKPPGVCVCVCARTPGWSGVGRGPSLSFSPANLIHRGCCHCVFAGTARRTGIHLRFNLRFTQIKGGEGNGSPFQYSCLENPRDRGAWWGCTESDTTEVT